MEPRTYLHGAVIRSKAGFLPSTPAIGPLVTHLPIQPRISVEIKRQPSQAGRYCIWCLYPPQKVRFCFACFVPSLFAFCPSRYLDAPNTAQWCCFFRGCAETRLGHMWPEWLFRWFSPRLGRLGVQYKLDPEAIHIPSCCPFPSVDVIKSHFYPQMLFSPAE